MSSIILVWLEFVLCAALIGYAGMHLIRYGDSLAELTGLSRGWIGLILVATVTSLPELVTGLSAVTVSNAPDIAVGDVLGSCVLNLAILAVVDALYRTRPLFTMVSHDHILPAGLGVLLLLSTGLILVLSQHELMPSVGHVGAGSFLLIALYVLAMKMLYQVEQRRGATNVGVADQVSLRRGLTGYAMSALVIVAAGIWLPFLGVSWLS